MSIVSKISAIFLVAGLSSQLFAREVTSLEERQKIMKGLVALVNQQKNFYVYVDKSAADKVICLLGYTGDGTYNYVYEASTNAYLAYDRSRDSTTVIKMTINDSQPVLTMESLPSRITNGSSKLMTTVTTDETGKIVSSVFVNYYYANLINVGTLLQPKEEVQWQLDDRSHSIECRFNN